MVNREQTRIEGGRRVTGVSPELPPLVSVIIAVYNGAATLERALRSVITQTFSRLELIIVDGGSSDCSIDIIRNHEYSIDYWISEPDTGIYDALNKGIALATGEWMYFLGADDALVDANVFTSVFSKQYDSKFIYGDVIYGSSGNMYGGEFTKRKLIHKNICQQGILYHADLFKELGYFDLNYPLLADWAFNMRAMDLPHANPTHITLVFAEYSLEGASTRIVDSAFAQDRLGLIRKYLGISCFLSALLMQLKDQIVATVKKHAPGTLVKIVS